MWAIILKLNNFAPCPPKEGSKVIYRVRRNKMKEEVEDIN